MKVCRCCSEVLPETSFTKSKSHKDGLLSICVNCRSEKRKIYRKANAEKVVATEKAYRADKREKVLSWKKADYQRNRVTIRASQNKLWEKNNERYALTAKAWREKNSDYLKEAKKLHRESRRDLHRASRAKRRATLKNATPSWLTEAQHSQIKDTYWLARDLEITSGEKYQVDHIIPLRGKSVCGLHVPWNLQVLPADINLSKGNRLGGTIGSGSVPAPGTPGFSANNQGQQ